MIIFSCGRNEYKTKTKKSYFDCLNEFVVQKTT